MHEHSFTIPTPPPHSRLLPEMRVALSARRAAPPISELREACLIGGFALAIFWVAAELAIAFGLR